MKESRHQRHEVRGRNRHYIYPQTWEPKETLSGVIQVLHGLGEHSDRYARFAARANDRGYAVITHDHRGHGARSGTLGHFADDDGWDLVISDALLVNEFAQKRFPDAALTLLGHSMGSYIAEDLAMRQPQSIAALVLSASTWPSRAQLKVLRLVAGIEAWRLGGRGYSALLNKLGFGNFNKPFAPHRTGSDWLSRDEAEVDRYVADPLCGGPYTCRLWRDLLGGLLGISTLAAITKIPAELPILIMGGERDPVGGARGMARLAERYRDTGHEHVTLTVYAGGRHEMLNETNRDEVMGDLLDWIRRSV